MAKYDDMSFGKAFAAARKDKGKGKTFTWKGKSYTTNRADDTASGSSGEDQTVARARRAIERREAEEAPAVRPRARPANNGKTPAVRPRARRPEDVPVTRDASSPKVTTSDIPAPKPSGRTSRPPEGPSTTGSGTIRSRGGYSFDQWREMTRREREDAGLPTSITGAQIYFRRSQTSGNSNSGGTSGSSSRRTARMAKGGMVKANCGASMKPTQKSTKK